jgi:AAA+ ATPase superfamily predicted ATPase
MILIARDEERRILEECYRARKPEFVVVYGRRRVGNYRNI